MNATLKQIVDLRSELGMTQDEFAEHLGVSRGTVSRMEQGHITARKWGAILKKLGRPYEALYTVKPPGEEPGAVLPGAPEAPVLPEDSEAVKKLKQDLVAAQHTLEQLQHAIKYGFGEEFVAPVGDLANGRARFVARASQKSNPPYDLVLQWINAVPASRLAWEETVKIARDTHGLYLHGPSAAYAFHSAWLASQQAALKLSPSDMAEKDEQIRELNEKLNDALGVIGEAGL